MVMEYDTMYAIAISEYNEQVIMASFNMYGSNSKMLYFEISNKRHLPKYSFREGTPDLIDQIFESKKRVIHLSSDIQFQAI
jgi:hypothetical protein